MRGLLLLCGGCLDGAGMLLGWRVVVTVLRGTVPGQAPIHVWHNSHRPRKRCSCKGAYVRACWRFCVCGALSLRGCRICSE